jgi:hypothetical protein
VWSRNNKEFRSMARIDAREHNEPNCTICIDMTGILGGDMAFGTPYVGWYLCITWSTRVYMYPS